MSTLRRMIVLKCGIIIKAWTTEYILNLSQHTERTSDNKYRTEFTTSRLSNTSNVKSEINQLKCYWTWISWMMSRLMSVHSCVYNLVLESRLHANVLNIVRIVKLIILILHSISLRQCFFFRRDHATFIVFKLLWQWHVLWKSMQTQLKIWIEIIEYKLFFGNPFGFIPIKWRYLHLKYGYLHLKERCICLKANISIWIRGLSQTFVDYLQNYPSYYRILIFNEIRPDVILMSKKSSRHI